MRFVLCFAFALLAFPSSMAHAAPDPAVGEWRAAEGPELASRLALDADGRFRFMLSYGALDEGAEGHWRRNGPLLLLTTEPRPKPPAIMLAIASPESQEGAPLSLIVVGPGSGDGIPGIDFRIEFDRGDPAEGYTQQYGWAADSLDGRTPLWVTLHEPVNDIRSERFAIPPGTHALRFLFQPNDLGKADFKDTVVTMEGEQMMLKHRMGDLHYDRAEE